MSRWQIRFDWERESPIIFSPWGVLHTKWHAVEWLLLNRTFHCISFYWRSAEKYGPSLNDYIWKSASSIKRDEMVLIVQYTRKRLHLVTSYDSSWVDVPYLIIFLIFWRTDDEMLFLHSFWSAFHSPKSFCWMGGGGTWLASWKSTVSSFTGSNCNTYNAEKLVKAEKMVWRKKPHPEKYWFACVYAVKQLFLKIAEKSHHTGSIKFPRIRLLARCYRPRCKCLSV